LDDAQLGSKEGVKLKSNTNPVAHSDKEETDESPVVPLKDGGIEQKIS
jgi:hypothetical protein